MDNKAFHKYLLDQGLEYTVLQILYDKQDPIGLDCAPIVEALRYTASQIIAGTILKPSPEVAELFQTILNLPDDDENIH
jgi:hypothetical protein